MREEEGEKRGVNERQKRKEGGKRFSKEARKTMEQSKDMRRK